MENNLQIRTKIQISKSPAAVYEAIVDPGQMSNYFISKGSLRMEAGAEPFWYFPEFAEGFSIRVKEVRTNAYVAFYWDTEIGETLVEISIEPVLDEEASIVTVTEAEALIDEPGILWLKNNTEGWANFLACLKAWLEYGVHLRHGAFDFMKSPD